MNPSMPPALKDARAIKIQSPNANPYWGMAFGDASGTPDAVVADTDTQNGFNTFQLHDDGTIWGLNRLHTWQPCIFYKDFALVLRAEGDKTPPPTFQLTYGTTAIQVNGESNTYLALFAGGLVIKSDSPVLWQVTPG